MLGDRTISVIVDFNVTSILTDELLEVKHLPQHMLVLLPDWRFIAKAEGFSDVLW